MADSVRNEFDAHLERRVPPLAGARNFRDLGGYQTADGRRVRWGRLYRSGSMSALTDADCEKLAALGIRSVCDLRTQEERAAEPNVWARSAGVKYWCRDYATSFGVLRTLLASGLPTAQDARAAMIDGYRRLPFEQAPAHRAMFEHLRSGEVPLVFNCSAGKDRTGTAAAVLLSALGVARETVIADYRLTDQTLDRAGLVAASAGRRDAALAKIPPEVVGAVLGAHADYIATALDTVEERHGSIEAYLQDVLALGRGDLAHIRDMLLE